MIERVKNSPFWYTVFLIFSGFPVIIAINQVFRLRLFGVTMLDNSYLYCLLGFYLSLIFLVAPLNRSAPRDRVPWYDAVLFLCTAGVSFYFMLHGLDIVRYGWEYVAPAAPTAFSVVMWILTIEAVRRASDLVMMLFCLVFSLYPLFASILPGILQGQSFDFLTTARLHAMSMSSILGIPLFTVCTLLLGFMIFGVVLQATGGGTFFFNLAQALMGQARGGAAKIGVLGSCFFGMLSGSTVSNVLTIGSMTIPAMKRTGFAPHYAAAIESCASAGGPIMPPVMGAAAFVMASFLNMPYGQICLAALVPALLYFFGLFVQIDGYAVKTGLKGIPRSELPSFWGTLKEGWFYLVVIFILCYFLLTLKIESWAPFYASGALLVLAMLNKKTRLTWAGFLEMIVSTGLVIIKLLAILAAAGLIVGGLSVTGVALSFSRELVSLVGNNTLLILIFGALTSFVLGLGMTTTACYIFLAIIMCPALIAMGIDPVGAHLFVLYWGALSEITPPVALCVAAAAGIARADFLQSGWTAMRLGAVKYIVPFFFAYSPALLMRGPWLEVLAHIVFAFAGVFILSSALEGYLVGIGRLDSRIIRLVFFIGGLLLAFPDLLLTIAGFGIIAGGAAAAYLLRLREKRYDLGL